MCASRSVRLLRSRSLRVPFVDRSASPHDRPEPQGAELRIRSNPHDFGSYLSVVCSFDPSDEVATGYAYRCEAEGPTEWDEEARRELDREEKR